MTKEWSYIIDIPPVATPRPNFRSVKGADGKTKNITYYPEKYNDYMRNVQEMLKRDNALNQDFYDVMAFPYGVKAEIKFFVKAPKGYKGVNNIMRTTAPDIDNLEKAVFDSIFKGLKIKDSRIVMVAKAKFQELHRPRTEITLKGIE